MLINNVAGERSAASMVKDSKFYIDLAKFVQAYKMIVQNPNEFLSEVGESPLKSASETLTWGQLVKIMQACDFGFEEPLSETDLVVLYNYATQMGSLGSKTKRIATVEDVANAQKHFYNFVDETTDKAELEYLKQKEILNNRDREARNIDAKLSAFKAKNVFAVVIMTFGVLLFCFGLVSLFFANRVASTIGSFLPVSNKSAVGGIVFIVLGIIIFALLNRFYLKTKYAYLKLKDASRAIFERSDACYNDTMVLKNKFNTMKDSLKIVKAELSDKEKTFDVTHNIEKLSETNKYYRQFAGTEFNFGTEQGELVTEAQEELASVKLGKEGYENVRSVSEAAISTERDFDSEQSKETGEAAREEEAAQSESEEVYEEFSGEANNDAVINEEETKKLQEIERSQRERKQREKQKSESIEEQAKD